MNKVHLLTLLLKLLKTKKQLGNPLSSILGCKSYIFDEQFNTSEIKQNIDSIFKFKTDLKEREELTSYDPKITEDILLWFQTHKCKTPTEKLIFENIPYNSSYEWLQMVNESSFIQNLLYYSNLIVEPVFVTSFICVITCIFIYYLLMVNYKLKLPLLSFVNILKNSILIRNNFIKIILTRLKDAKYILITSLILCFINFGIHIYNVNLLTKDTKILYDKIKLFKRQIQQMRNISERLCEMKNETIDYFMEKLKVNDEAFYERSVNKWVLLMNRGRIISDYFKIANKKNKLGKLFQLNGMCSYIKL
jgi:hypothetical protein